MDVQIGNNFVGMLEDLKGLEVSIYADEHEKVMTLLTEIIDEKKPIPLNIYVELYKHLAFIHSYYADEIERSKHDEYDS